MRLFLVLAALAVAGGYFRIIPALSGVSDLPLPLVAGGLATVFMIFVLAKVEP